MVAKVTEALNQAHEDANLRAHRAKAILTNNIGETLADTLKSFVSEGDIDTDTAQNIYDSMATKCGFEDANLSVQMYDVTVTLDGTEIAVVEVEAIGEGEACDSVSDDFILYNADVTVTFRYNGDNYEYEASGVEHLLSEYQDSLEFTAEKQ
jgi:hypothetical protein